MEVSSEGINPFSEQHPQHQQFVPEDDVATLEELQFGGMEDFSEDDVLPFLLQAQDIIAKLEGRVLDLETDLSTIHRKYEHDRHDWLVGLSQKDQYIHHLSKKLQKLEFNSKEAIVLISDHEGAEPGHENNLTLALNFLRQAQQTTATPPVADDFPDDTDDLEEGELERRAAAANEWRKQEEYASGGPGTAGAGTTATVPTNTTTSFRVSPWTHHSEQPVNLMEGLESSVDGSEISRHTDVDSLQADSTGGSGGTFSTTTSISSMTRMPSTDGNDQQYHHLQQQHGATLTPPPNDPTTTPGTPVVEPSSRPTTTTTSSVPLPTTDHSNFCGNCRQLLTQLDQQIEQKAYMKRDLSSLASALSEEEQLRFSIEQVKDSLEEDIQDVTADLFKTLNSILMDEVNDREGLLRLDRETGGKLTSVLQAWDSREERLREIKEQLVELDAAVNQSTTASERLSRYRQDDFDAAAVLPRSRMMRHSSLRLSSPTSPLVPLSEDESMLTLGSGSGGTGLNKTVRIDGMVFDEFQQHVKVLTSSASSPSTATSQLTMPATPFMKRVIAEDVEPCLFQTGAGSSWWKSPWFKRKLTDAIVANRCDIQSWNSSNNNTAFSSSASSSPATSHISTTSSTSAAAFQQQQQLSAPKTKCTCCGMLRICEFRMRLQHSSQVLQGQQKKPAPWLPIDRFCRDRIVAVCDFYSFMSHLRQGFMQNSPVLQMFKQCQHYRRRMGLAKVGSMSLFDECYDGGVNLRSPTSSKSKRRSRSSKRESLVLEYSGNNSDSGSVVSVTDVQGIYGPGQIVIVH
ncbi:hypothetical protein INT45_013937 [Circinella minor]|uniref:GDP/GTP exchange factor Sec2 N-terminal domain-containing protein n=1 Tax=Circinella minor TaxID=1195481 RepID=A0A8H7VFM2_9FUNG|nr:hypothetical protein INT45_013937 [Circinella minor]